MFLPFILQTFPPPPQISISWKFLSDIRFLQFLLPFPLIFFAAPDTVENTASYTGYLSVIARNIKKNHPNLSSFLPFFRPEKEEEEEEGKNAW